MLYSLLYPLGIIDYTFDKPARFIFFKREIACRWLTYDGLNPLVVALPGSLTDNTLLELGTSQRQ